MGGVKTYGRWAGLGLMSIVIQILSAKHYRESLLLLGSTECTQSDQSSTGCQEAQRKSY